MKRILISFVAAMAALAMYAQTPEIPGQGHALMKVDATQKCSLSAAG